MFCTGCGKQLKDGVKFCNYCGKKITPRPAPGDGNPAPPVKATSQAPVNPAPAQPVNPAPVPPVNPAPVNPPSPPAKKKGKTALLIILPIAGVLLAAAVVLGILFRKEIMDLFRKPTPEETVAVSEDDTDEEERTDKETEEESEDASKAETSETTEPETTEPESPETTETDASEVTESETESASERSLELAAESETTESVEEMTETSTEATTEELTEEPTEETTEETTEGLPSMEEQLIGFWVGDQASEITLREDGSCFYQEPENTANERVRAGVECEWRLIGNRMMIINAADYIIYADLDRYNVNTEMTILSDSESWTTETFTKQ